MKKTFTKTQLREFSYVVGVGFPLIVGYLIPYFSGHTFRTWTLLFGLTILCVGLLYPSILKYPYKAWMFIGNTLGWFNSKLILGLVFFLVLQPIALIMKFFRYDPLKRKKSKLSSYKEQKKDYKSDLTKIY